MNSVIKIILIDVAGLAYFAALVMFPDAIGGITIVALGGGFVVFMLWAAFSSWTWRDTAGALGPPVIGAVLSRLSRGDRIL